MKIIYVLFAIFATGTCKTFERCELARELIRAGLPRNQIATWVCIAFKESSYNTKSINYSSQCYGLFQIRQEFWCSPGHINRCNMQCTQFLDDNVLDDVKCVKIIYDETKRLSGNGFTAWDTYSSCLQPNSYIANCHL